MSNRATGNVPGPSDSSPRKAKVPNAAPVRLVHGMCWSFFDLFLQPTAWDTVRMAITGVALAFVAQRTRSSWPGIVGHVSGNLPFLLSLVGGV